MIRPRHPRQTLSQSRGVPGRAPSTPALFLPRATRAMRPFPFSPLLRNSFVCLGRCFVPSGRNVDLACPLSHLDATFTSYRVSVENKGLTGRLSLLDATFTKNRGGTRLLPWFKMLQVHLPERTSVIGANPGFDSLRCRSQFQRSQV